MSLDKTYFKCHNENELCSTHMPELSSVSILVLCPWWLTVVAVPDNQNLSSTALTDDFNGYLSNQVHVCR